MAKDETSDATARRPQGTKGTSAKRPAATKAATPWGPATVVEEVKVAQRVGDKRFASLVQLLEDAKGEPLVRISYTTDGVARRGPVTLRPKDVERLRASLAPGSPLAAALGWDAPDTGGDA